MMQSAEPHRHSSDSAAPDRKGDQSTALTAQAFIEAMQRHSAVELEKMKRYFKSGVDDYGAGDLFVGVRMGQVFASPSSSAAATNHPMLARQPQRSRLLEIQACFEPAFGASPRTETILSQRVRNLERLPAADRDVAVMVRATPPDTVWPCPPSPTSWPNPATSSSPA
jgi:hypothetical protein